MEASRFDFGRSMPPAFKYDPTDDDIVAHYLLPRALGIPDPPFAHAVIEDDPASLPPPELLARHGHVGSHHAFFVHTIDMSKNGGRRERVIRGGAGGMWRGQQGRHETLTLLSPGGGREVDITYKRYDLTYKKFDDDDEEEHGDVTKGKKRKRADGNGGTPSGWVMHEFQIISPPLQNTVLSCIKRTKAKIKEDQQQADAEAQSQQLDFDQQQQLCFPAHDQPDTCYYQDEAGPSNYQNLPCQDQAGPSTSSYHDFPYQEQPGPSYFCHPLDTICGASGEGFNDGSQQADDASFHGQDFPYLQELAGPSYQSLPIPEQSGPGYFCHPLDMVCGGSSGEGFSDGSQADDASFHGQDFPYQEQAGPSYQSLPIPEQADPGYFCHPLDMICGVGGEGFSDGSQAGDASCYGDNGAAMGDCFLNLLQAGEGLTGDNTNLYYDGFHFSASGRQHRVHHP
uniref:Uncharacterized protein n=1 Tax=Avena sativa TaxID=4498 RepID=A0ACD5WR53_AVESA